MLKTEMPHKQAPGKRLENHSTMVRYSMSVRFFLFLHYVLFHIFLQMFCVSRQRVRAIEYALRVIPAETKLTVYRRRQFWLS